MMTEKVILVDENDRETDIIEKMKAHEDALLHRAFSIFIFNSEGKMLLQQRAFGKYHSGGLWTNACCSHPRPGESIDRAAHRRLKEEMGFDCPLSEFFQFIYLAELDHGLIEHEYDHVFTGIHDGPMTIDPAEVASYRWMTIDELRTDVKRHPENYTIWFRIALDRVLEHVNSVKAE